MKRGLSAVIASLILILLALVAIGIVWIIINNLINKTSEKISIDPLTNRYSIDDLKIGFRKISMRITKTAGEANATEFRFLIEGKYYTTQYIEKNPDLNKLESKTYVIRLNNYIGTVKKIIMVPFFGDKVGLENNPDVRNIGVDPTLDDSLVGYWNMDSFEGTNSEDYVSGLKGNAIHFNDTELVSVNVSSDKINIDNELTLATWVKLEPTTQCGKIIVKPYIIDKNPWELYAFDRCYFDRYIRFVISNGIGNSYNSIDGYKEGPISGWKSINTSELDYDRWYHIVGTYNGSIMTMYLNGQELSSLKTNIRLGKNDMPLYIGGRNPDEYWLSSNSIMDEVLIYNRSLNSEEVQILYNWR